MISFNSEKDMETFLVEHEDFIKEYFNLPDHTIYRQPRLGGYGIADLIAVSCRAFDDRPQKFVDIVIIELKNTPISLANVAQVARYRDFFQRLLDCTPDQIDVSGILIGLKTFPSSDDLCFLCQNIDWLSVYELGLDPREGIVFNHIAGWRPSSHTEEAALAIYESMLPPVQVIAPLRAVPMNEAFS